MKTTTTFNDAVQEALDLRPDTHGENPEYLRGMCELIARCFPDGTDTTTLAAKIQRIVEVPAASETPPEDGVITTTDAEHAAESGLHCPKCGSGDLDSGSLQADDGHAWAEVTCNDCGLEYQDTYALVGFNAG